LARAEQAIERAKRLTMQMLTFAHGGDPVREVSDIGALLQETIYFDLSGSNVQPSISCPPDLYPAEVDRGQIQQAISNLTINAMQAMPTGGQLSIVLCNVELSAGDVAHLPPGRYVQITFQDEGTGIEPRHLDRIFDPYFSTKQTGSGLGLAVTHSIINKHGGHIAITSQPGRGTTATLYLPALMTKLPIEAISPTPTAPSEPLCPARILVMDDEEILRSAVAELLELEGYEVVTVANGEEAFAAYQLSLEEGRTFSAIIMDLTIPGGMGGQEAVQAILRLDPQARCIASSGYATDPIMANYAQYGFRGVVKKPYNFRQLQETLAEVIESSDS
jgi:CheY-like chemotaxis protein